MYANEKGIEERGSERLDDMRRTEGRNEEGKLAPLRDERIE